MKTAIFYGSSTGNTESAAKMIFKKLGGEEVLDIFDIASVKVEKMSEYEKLILGTSTWGDGDLQDDWDSAFEKFKSIDFSKKTVAFFGLGDQEEYPDEFVGGIGTLYEVVNSQGAKVVGKWPVDGYYHDSSKAQDGDYFVGLALDDDNQSDMTDGRIESWCEQIRSEILG
ncbi:MAG: flavodoxin [Sulfurimonas sp.]|jgi:flavodoxin I|uniref:flavodoxin n=1 Tax=Sulfurimonas sp. TaxID=2022749 RepID=UPI002B82EFAD|nr:flavodoxin [Sulfurimonas sp.]HUH43056.1 flavodoxin [Sulfurimonas sp.]